MKERENGGTPGRKSAYREKIAPNLDTIQTMVQFGVPQQKIREILGVSRSTWEKYKSEKTEFSDALSAKLLTDIADHAEDVKRLEECMIKLALGFSVSVKRYINCKEGPVLVEEEVYSPPNFQACRFLLLNWGGYMSEPAAQAQREREFEHKKAMDAKNDW